MKDSEILYLAAEIVSQGFTKDAYAKDLNSNRVGVMDPNAIKFDMVGAVCRAVGGSVKAADAIIDKWVKPTIPPRAVLTDFLGGPLKSFVQTSRAWNDDPACTQGDVVSKLKAGAKAAQEKGE